MSVQSRNIFSQEKIQLTGVQIFAMFAGQYGDEENA